MKKIALSVAGFDPSSGAGLTADLKTFQSCGVYGVSAVTAITIQNSKTIKKVEIVKQQIVQQQIMALLDDFNVNAIKIGMLGNEEVVDAVISSISNFEKIPVVLDPVFYSSSGFQLLDKNGIKNLIEKLIPKVDLITPNISEAEIITGLKIDKENDFEKAANKILKMGVKNVVIKGGHSLNNANDLFCSSNQKVWLRSKREDKNDVHGTGCAFSAAITAHLCFDCDYLKAVYKAKEFIKKSIVDSIKIGKGSRLIDAD